MFRRSSCRLGHQLLKEPLGNEHSSLARGKRVQAMSKDHLAHRFYMAGSGFVAFAYATFWCGSFTRERVTSEGKYVAN